MDRLRAAKWEDLEAIELGGRVYFQEVIQKAKADGSLEDVKILVRVPRKPERRKARLEARAWAERVKVDPEKDPELFDDMDTLCILAGAIREATGDHEQHRTPEMLEAEYDSRSLLALWERLQVYEDLIDPRPGELDDENFWRTVQAIGRTRSALPLTGLGSRAQNACITRMALEAWNARTRGSSSGSSELSTPES